MPQQRRHFSNPAPRRVSAQIVLVHPDGRVLMLDLVGRRCRSIPGGHCTPEESPHLTARRLLRAQLGLDVPFTGADLALVDYSPANPEQDAREGFNFLFVQRLTFDEVRATHVPDDADPDVRGYEWLRPADLPTVCAQYHVDRVSNTLARLYEPTAPAYFVAGRPAV